MFLSDPLLKYLCLSLLYYLVRGVKIVEESSNNSSNIYRTIGNISSCFLTFYILINSSYDIGITHHKWTYWNKPHLTIWGWDACHWFIVSGKIHTRLCRLSSIKIMIGNLMRKGGVQLQPSSLIPTLLTVILLSNPSNLVMWKIIKYPVCF